MTSEHNDSHIRSRTILIFSESNAGTLTGTTFEVNWPVGIRTFDAFYESSVGGSGSTSFVIEGKAREALLWSELANVNTVGPGTAALVTIEKCQQVRVRIDAVAPTPAGTLKVWVVT